MLKTMERALTVNRLNILPEVEVPLFDQKQTAVAQARHRLRQSQKRLIAKEDEIRTEIRSTYFKFIVTRGAVETYLNSVLPLHEKFIDSLQKHYNFMLVGVYDLLNAKKDEIESYHKFVESLKEYWILRSDLERLIGEKSNMFHWI